MACAFHADGNTGTLCICNGTVAAALGAGPLMCGNGTLCENARQLSPHVSKVCGWGLYCAQHLVRTLPSFQVVCLRWDGTW